MNEQFFIHGTTFLMDAEKWFLPPINELCRLMADVIQAGGIRVEGANPVRPMLDFMVGVRKNDKPDVAKILIPKGWWQRMMQNPWYKLGGVVFMASHACDFYYGMLPSMRRAKAWEAQFLLGAARRAAQALGYRRLLTYTLPEEGGASLRAAGWVPAGRTAGGSWSHPSRRRTDRAPTCAKLRWSCPLRGRHDAQGAWRASAGGLSPGER
jgi:hypothetical protein